MATNYANITNTARNNKSKSCSYLSSSVLFVGFALFAAFPFPLPAQAGSVTTPAGRLEGPVALAGGNLTAAGKPVAWEDVLVAVAEASDARPAGEAIYLDTGEVWGGQVTKLAAGRITIASPLLGAREVDLAAVRSIDFAPDLPVPEAQNDGVLYRLKGNPVRGALVSLEGQKISVETALGPVPLDRGTVKRYVFAGAPRKAAPTGDEVTLTDGSVLMGKLAPTGAGLTLKHPVLGDVNIAANQWRSLRRRTEKVTYLAEQTPDKVETFPLIRLAANPPAMERARTQAPGTPAPGYVSRIRIWPHTIVRYSLPGEAGQKVSFRAQVSLAEGSRGALAVRVKVGEKVAFEAVLDPKDPKPAAVAFEADAGGVLTLEVDFDKTIRFPCSVTVDDPLVLRK
ncbi:MAG: hypothetical protein NTV86_08565 [Planctomycetota bacterium]|nr:hypothetical protein [Planctomycetota bacterium]